MDAFRPFETRRCTGEFWAADAGAIQSVPARLAIDAKSKIRVCMASIIIAVNRNSGRISMERARFVRLAIIVALALWSSNPAHAAEITVLVNQGAVSGVRELAAGFEKASGHKVVVDFVGAPEQTQKINSYAPGDVVVNFISSFEDLIKRNKVGGSVVEFARAG